MIKINFHATLPHIIECRCLTGTESSSIGEFTYHRQLRLRYKVMIQEETNVRIKMPYSKPKQLYQQMPLASSRQPCHLYSRIYGGNRFESSQPLFLVLRIYRPLSVVFFSFPGWLGAIEYLFKF